MRSGIELRKVQVMEALRRERNAKLAETDWMLLSDTAEMSEDWKNLQASIKRFTRFLILQIQKTLHGSTKPS